MALNDWKECWKSPSLLSHPLGQWTPRTLRFLLCWHPLPPHNTEPARARLGSARPGLRDRGCFESSQFQSSPVADSQLRYTDKVYVGVIRLFLFFCFCFCFFNILQLLLIRFTQQNMCCISESTWMKHQHNIETPIHDNIRELVTWECKEHGVKSWMC
jgi:hypothetical protein